MKPYYSDDLVSIYLGDCRSVRDWLAADVLITDPPYGLGGALSMSGYASEQRFGIQDWDASLAVRNEVLAMWGRDRPSAVFGSPRRLSESPPHREVPLVWDKGDMVAMGDTSFPWRATYELIYIDGDGWGGHRDPGVIRVPHNSSQASAVGHPSVKPVGLLVRLIRKTTGVIADPFMGSGTTLVAAKQLGRTAIGVEIEERYCELAANRLAQETLGITA